MLVLTRKLNQAIVIGEDISVKILGVQRGCVKLGIDAPRDVSIHREEIYHRIQNGREHQSNEGNPKYQNHQ
jgi:carbon storage regulator